MVFSRDVLFLHVPKAGGVSVAEYLLEALPRPVFYVSPGHLGYPNEPGLIHIPGLPHKPLSEARELLREQGLDIGGIPLILAVLRNPYDIMVSNYAYQRRETVSYELMDERQSPPRRPVKTVNASVQELTELIRQLRPGTTARIEPTGRDRTSRLRRELIDAGSRLGQVLEVWTHDGILYAELLLPDALNESERRGTSIRKLAEDHEFKVFLLEENRQATRPWLSRLYDFYHLDGAMPPNLRIVRFERMAEDLVAALGSIGVEAEVTLPWLNRSDRGDFADYYDEETEAIVYEQARWMFDGGYYARLDRTPGA